MESTLFNPLIASHYNASWKQQWDEMYLRFFDASKVCHRRKVCINTQHIEKTGLIGEDKKYQFSTIQDKSGSPLSLDQKSFYVPLEFTQWNRTPPLILKIIEYILSFFFKKETLDPPPPHLPSTLFENAKEGDTISYTYQGHSWELLLEQKSAPSCFQPGFYNSFEKAFELIKAANDIDENYIFREDIPSNRMYIDICHSASKAGDPALYFEVLSQNAKISLSGKELTPVTQEQLQQFQEKIKEWVPLNPNEDGTPQGNTVFLSFLAPGCNNSNLSYIIDERALYLCIERPPILHTSFWPQFIRVQFKKPIKSTTVEWAPNQGVVYFYFTLLIFETSVDL